MISYDFLKKHPYYSSRYKTFKDPFNQKGKEICFLFVRKEDEVFETGSLFLLIREDEGDTEVNFLFSSTLYPGGCQLIEDTPDWFHELYHKAKHRHLHTTRLRKIFETKP